MTLKEIIDKTNFMELWAYLISIYSDYDNDNSMVSHFAVFEKLKNMEPVHRNMKIFVTYANDPNYTGWVTDGIEEGEMYALDFTPWNEWLGMEIEPETLNRLQPHEIAAHCLFEMSFYSFDEEEIQTTLNSLRKTVEELETQGSTPS